MTKKDFLVIFVSAYPPDTGRLSEYGKEIVDGIVRKIGHDKRVLVLSDSLSGCEANVICKAAWKPDSVAGILKLYLNILRARCRLIHFNLHLAVFGSGRLVNFLGLLSTTVARLSGKKVIVTLHNIPDAINVRETKLRETLMNRVGLTLATKILILSSNIVVVTVKRYVSLLKKRYSAKCVKYIPHGAWFTQCDFKWNMNSPPNILFIGYLAPYKDIERLIEIADVLRKSIPDLKLLISGDAHPNYPEFKALFLKLISDKPFIKYFGRVPNHELPNLVSSAKLLVLPYRTSTGTSGVYHLVAGLGIPVIAPPTIEFRELYEEGGGISLIDLWGEDAAQDILEILLDEGRLCELSRKNVEFALKRSWDIVAEEYIKLYRYLLRC
jgi:glycosyltransferase involved in cell wall biosynthesis